MFRDIFKIIKKEAEKVIDEADKQKEDKSEERRQEKTVRSSQAGNYGRLAAWIKSNYGNWFRDGDTADEVKLQLEKVYRERERMGDFRNNPDIVKGFRAYIDKRKYGNLVRVRE